MCWNKDCPLASQCYRHEASGTKPNPYRQTYGDFDFAINDEGEAECENFWDRKEYLGLRE